MNLSEGKELFIGNKENGGTAVSKDIPIPSKNAGIFCLPFGFTPLTEVRRGRGLAVSSRRKYCAPCLAQGDRQTGVLPTIECHPEHARIVVPVATYCSHLRARRSFADKARCI